MAIIEDGVIILSDSPSPPAPRLDSPPASSPLSRRDATAASPLFDFPSPPIFDEDEAIDRLFQVTADESAPMAPVLRSGSDPASQGDELSNCEQAVQACFPDICPDYLREQATSHAWDSHALISRILDDLEKGQPYPKRESLLKRKRRQDDERPEDDEDETLRKKFAAWDPRLASKGRGYVKSYIRAAKILLKAEFPQLYSDDVEKVLKDNNYQLYSAFIELDKTGWSPDAKPNRIKKVTGRRSNPEDELRNSRAEPDMDALAAFDAARASCLAKAQARNAEDAQKKRAEQEEQANLERAKADGTVAECGCCFSETALNRMAHCNGGTAHFFCLDCAKQMAEHVIGDSKYHLGCMSMDGCDATFSRDQKKLFMDDHMTKAIEQIEQEAVLRMAGIENLVTCPFCDYAAEYPPVEENKEFRCEMPDCGIVSCRLCREETHIPKSCQEAARERGVSARRVIEEAMSAAVIRKCNKCGTPFIKENGCNKMTCTRSGCRNVQCYVCSKSCDYSHFNDPTRGGKPGNCPLFDDVEDRHEHEVHAAEEEARKKVANSVPGVDAAMLKIDFSEKVKQDDAKRKAASLGRMPAGAMRWPAHPGQVEEGILGRPVFAGFPQQVMQAAHGVAPRIAGQGQPAQPAQARQRHHVPAEPAVPVANAANARPQQPRPAKVVQHQAHQPGQAPPPYGAWANAPQHGQPQQHQAWQHQPQQQQQQQQEPQPRQHQQPQRQPVPQPVAAAQPVAVAPIHNARLGWRERFALQQQIRQGTQVKIFGKTNNLTALIRGPNLSNEHLPNAAGHWRPGFAGGAASPVQPQPAFGPLINQVNCFAAAGAQQTQQVRAAPGPVAASPAVMHPVVGFGTRAPQHRPGSRLPNNPEGAGNA